jgi:hypothetical protein
VVIVACKPDDRDYASNDQRGHEREAVDDERALNLKQCLSAVGCGRDKQPDCEHSGGDPAHNGRPGERSRTGIKRVRDCGRDC